MERAFEKILKLKNCDKIYIHIYKNSQPHQYDKYAKLLKDYQRCLC